MRLTPIIISLGIAAATFASAGNSQRPDDQVDPRSAALVAQAQTRTGAGQYQEAIDLLETALAVDPGNRGASIALGRVARLDTQTSAVQLLPSTEIYAVSRKG